MFYVDALWVIVLGILAVPSLLLSKRPDAKEILDKITPYQGWIGVISALWGIWRLIEALTNTGLIGMGGKFMIFWITFAAYGAVMLILGFMLGIGVLKTFIKNEEAQAKMDETLAKLQPKQGTLGIVAICIGVALIIERIAFF